MEVKSIKRKSPIQHTVHKHQRKGRVIYQFLRGKGSNSLKVANPKPKQDLVEPKFLYHITNYYGFDGIRNKGLLTSFDENLSAKDMEKGQVVNLVTEQNISKLLHAFASLDPDDMTFHPEIILKIEVDNNFKIQKVQHKNWKFSWIISLKDIPKQNIVGYMKTQDWINSKEKWSPIDKKLWS